MGLAYRLRLADLLAGVEGDAEFLAVNPAEFSPAIQDGEVTIVESIAIMDYLMARHGPTTNRFEACGFWSDLRMTASHRAQVMNIF